jgi:hypothetical protein
MMWAFAHDKPIQNSYFSSYLQLLNENCSHTLDAKVFGLKPYSLNDVLHILRELEYALPIIPHL